MRRLRRPDPRDEHGIVLVWFALTLVIMLFFAAFMVDLGYWYQQSQDIQRTVDAAALAGSTYLPNSPGSGTNPATCISAVPQDAYCAALAVVIKNGYAAGIGGTATLTTAVDASNNHQLDVTLTTSVHSFFAEAFVGNLTFSRTSDAQFSQAIPLGSPQEYFGTGTLTGWPGFTSGSTTTNFYATIMGYCVAKENGDEYSSAFDYNATITNGAYAQPGACSSSATPTNTEWDGTGYEYDIVVPPDTVGEPDGTATANPVVLWVYNPAFSPCVGQDRNGVGMDVDRNTPNETGCAQTTRMDIHYELFPPTGAAEAPTGTTGLGVNFSSGTINTYTGASANVKNDWYELDGLSQVGTWRLVVSSVPVALDSTGTKLVVQNPVMPYAASGDYPFGEHRFSLLATESSSGTLKDNGTGTAISTNAVGHVANTPSGAVAACSTSTVCPEISASTATSMAVTIVGTSSGANGQAATAYLADVPKTAAGKEVELDLWDPGDYGQYIQILEPGGTTPLPTFSYEVAGSGDGSVANPPFTSAITSPQTASATCTDPVTGNPMLDQNGVAVVGPCFPVDGCVSGPSWVLGNAYATCPTGAPWPGGPDHLFGMAQYNDALVKIFFVPTAAMLPAQDNWFGIKEVTAPGVAVHDTLTIGLKVSGLPPHLTP